jgi:hypothetical protein
VPLVIAEQQPDRHAIVDEQLLTHRLMVQETEVAGQSPVVLQPHWPPPVTVTQRWPF